MKISRHFRLKLDPSGWASSCYRFIFSWLVSGIIIGLLLSNSSPIRAELITYYFEGNGINDWDNSPIRVVGFASYQFPPEGSQSLGPNRVGYPLANLSLVWNNEQYLCLPVNDRFPPFIAVHDLTEQPTGGLGDSIWMRSILQSNNGELFDTQFSFLWGLNDWTTINSTALPADLTFWPHGHAIFHSSLSEDSGFILWPNPNEPPIEFGFLSSKIPGGLAANDSVWLGASGKFENASAWHNAMIPSQSSRLLFSLAPNEGTSEIITFENDAWVGSMDFLGNRRLEFALNSNWFHVDDAVVLGSSPGDMVELSIKNGLLTTKDLVIGSEGHGILQLSHAGRMEAIGWDGTTLGKYTGSLGELHVSGFTSHFETPALVVGEQGTGQMVIEAGGRVTSNVGILGRDVGSSGTATVRGQSTGLHSTWSVNTISIGFHGTGVLNIEDGHVNSALGYLGQNADGHGTVTLTGMSSRWDVADLRIGNVGTGVLNISEGGEVSSQRGYIGRDIGSNGIATINGNGSTWQGSDLFVGYDGAGELNIEAGGNATFFSSYIGRNADSSGTATVSGSDSTWSNTWSLDVGYEGTGHLIIQDGGKVESTQGAIGRNPGSHGRVIVTGSNSLWTGSNNTLTVGYAGTGELRIEAGGSVSSGGGYIGRESNSNGTATVTGNESNWTNYSAFIIGDSGTGNLNIEGGGRVTSSGGIVGRYAGSVGTVSVSGGNSTWNNSIVGLQDIVIGDLGTGLLFIQNGGTVFNKTGFVGRFEDSFGSVLVAGSGSTWANSENLIVGGSSLTTGTTTGVGVLNVFEDGLVTVGETLRIHKNGTVNLQSGGLLVASDIFNCGWLSGVGSVVGNVVNDGIIAPGSSPGKLLIDGDYTQLAEGQLQIEFAGRTAGIEYDQLFVSGTASIEGMFLFHFLDGFAPLQGDTFDFLVASHMQVSSQIQVQIQNLLPGFEYNLSIVDGTYRLTALNDASFVPEPNSAVLLLLGLTSFVMRRRKLA